MTQQIINVGLAPNDGRGDSLRSGATKVNVNFTELYSQVGLLESRTVVPSQVGNSGKFLITTAGVLSWSSVPAATTTTLGGVKVDGTTIAITDQIIRVGSIPYNKISNPPTIPSLVSQLTNDSGFLTTVSWTSITNKPTFSTVATSGSYNNLLDKPVLFSGSYNDLTNKPTIATGVFIGTTNVSLNRASSNLALTGVSISGNAATVTNGVYTTGAYANPNWISSLAYSKLTGAPSISGNLDGGNPRSIYGGVTSIDAGGVTV